MKLTGDDLKFYEGNMAKELRVLVRFVKTGEITKWAAQRESRLLKEDAHNHGVTVKRWNQLIDNAMKRA